MLVQLIAHLIVVVLATLVVSAGLGALAGVDLVSAYGAGYVVGSSGRPLLFIAVGTLVGAAILYIAKRNLALLPRLVSVLWIVFGLVWPLFNFTRRYIL